MTKKITTLTPEQEQQLRTWRQHWLEVGTCTDRADRPKAEAAITKMYVRIGKPAPQFIWCESPATCLLAIHVLKQEKFWKTLRKELKKAIPEGSPLQASLQASLGASLQASLQASLWDSLQASLWDSLQASLGASLQASLWASLRDSLGASLGDSLRASLGDSLRDSLGASLQASLWDSLRASLGDSLRASLGDSLRASLWDSLGDSLGDSLRASLWASLGYQWWGQHDAYWISFYLFCRDVVGVKYADEKSDDLNLWRNIAESACWWWSYENWCIVSERPTVVKMEKWREAERLHCDAGPALAFADGWKVYSLHGVRVPEEIVMKPARDLDPQLILSEQNVEIRREILRKIGIERAIAELGAVMMDEQGDYALLKFNAHGQDRIYLKMKNPSVGVFHIEAVAPHIRTVEQAINWRAGDEQKRWTPSQLT